MAERPTPRDAILEGWAGLHAPHTHVEGPANLADIVLETLADAGYHVVHSELIPAFSEAFTLIAHQRDLAREICERRTDQRNRAVRALDDLLDETREHWGEASQQACRLVGEDWAQAVLDDD